MIGLTILGIICIFVGIVIAIVTVNKSISQSNGDEEKLKGYIDNLCLGSFVGALIIYGVFCLNVEKTDSKTQSNEEYNLSDSTLTNKPVQIIIKYDSKSYQFL